MGPLVVPSTVTRTYARLLTDTLAPHELMPKLIKKSRGDNQMIDIIVSCPRTFSLHPNLAGATRFFFHCMWWEKFIFKGQLQKNKGNQGKPKKNKEETIFLFFSFVFLCFRLRIKPIKTF